MTEKFSSTSTRRGTSGYILFLRNWSFSFCITFKSCVPNPKPNSDRQAVRLEIFEANMMANRKLQSQRYFFNDDISICNNKIPSILWRIIYKKKKQNRQDPYISSQTSRQYYECEFFYKGSLLNIYIHTQDDIE